MKKTCARVLFAVAFFAIAGCAGKKPSVPPPFAEGRGAQLPRIGFIIQAGAFAKVENAQRLTDRLNRDNLNAYYFVYREGLYKVRFGDFPSRDAALKAAEDLESKGVIEDHYIVDPANLPLAQIDSRGETYVRESLAATAERFLGVPYRWGGLSLDSGVDCSGLAMSVYRLIGLAMPRTAREQFQWGRRLQSDPFKGDLVFFDTGGDGDVTHVGLYVGGGRFIHAPGKGKEVRVDSLSNSYYRRCYRGSRSYL